MSKGFMQRAAALDHLEARLVGDDDPEYARLEALNERFTVRLRGRIRAGRYTPAGLRRAFGRLAGTRGYDALDQLVAGLLDVGPVGDEQVARGPEMVFYQPTPARVVLAFVERAGLGPQEACCDLGSGLGLVAILVALLSGARAYGVELEPAYVDYARESAAALGLEVGFTVGDAREAALGEAGAYFLYTPFRGSVLAAVLERLRGRARVVGTYGPCSAEVARLAPWLVPDGPPRDDALVVWRPAG